MTRYNQLLASFLIGHPQTFIPVVNSPWQLHVSSSSFIRFPEIQDMCIVPIDVILLLADPRARRDCIYTQSKKEVTSTYEHFLIVNASTD